jgi:hypothetical protein
MGFSMQTTVPVLALALVAGLSPLSGELTAETPSALVNADARTPGASDEGTPPTTDEVGWSSPSGIGIFGGSPGLHQRAETASQHFLEAGLDLRGVVIVFHPDADACGGHDGVYRSAMHSIDICNTNQLIIMHELAHAWDWANLDDETRVRYMELRGIERWNDASDPWKQRGIEDLAETVVWGLGRIGNCPSSSPDPDRTRAFRMITGIDLDSSAGEFCDHDREALAAQSRDLRSPEEAATEPLASTGDGLTR